MKITREEIPPGARGTAKTISRMHELVQSGKIDYSVISQANKIVLGAPRHDFLGELRMLHDWVQSNIRWTRDPHSVELLRSPQRLLELRSGDCDDHAILLCALAESVGFVSGFRTISTDPRFPDAWTHVYSVIEVPGHGWVASDTSDAKYRPLGWEYPSGRNAKVWRRPQMSGTSSLQQLPLDLEIDLLEVDELSRRLEPRPSMILEENDMGIVGELSLVTVEQAEAAPSLRMGIVSLDDAQEAPSLRGLGQLTKAEGAQVAAMKTQIRRAWWNPFKRAALSRQIARIEILARKRAAIRKVIPAAIREPGEAEGAEAMVRHLAERHAQERAAAAKATQIAAVIGAKPEIALGPISPAAKAVLPWPAIAAKATTKAKALVAQKNATLRALLAETKVVAAQEKDARMRGITAVVSGLRAKRQAFQAQTAKLVAAKVRPENIVRQEAEKARIMQAMGRGAAGVAQYGQRRFQEGKATASGVYQEAMQREFLGPYRTQ